MRFWNRLFPASPRLALRPVAALLALLAPCAAAAADSLVLHDVGAPTVAGPAGQGRRAIWVNAGTVGGVTSVDLVATLDRATLNHNFITKDLRAAVESVGQEDIHVTWRLVRSNSGYDIATDSGGTPVPADIHVQLNDIDGPANEQAFIPLCDGKTSWVRIDRSATTGRDFGTFGGTASTFALIGDRDYNSQPISGLEVLYPNTSSFGFGRTALQNYVIRVDRKSYGQGQTIDFICPDFQLTPVAVDDKAPLGSGAGTSFDILANDAATTGYTAGASEWLRNAVSLVPPSGASGVTTSYGRTTGFTTTEGTWSYDVATGALTFTPVSGLGRSPAPIQYTLEHARRPVGASPTVSAPATVSAAGVIGAAADTASVDGAAGNGNAGNVLANDTVSGRPMDAPSFTAAKVTPAVNPGIAIASNGTVSVAAGTPAGTYAVPYKACESAYPTNCGTGSLSVTVTRKAITAGPDGPYHVPGAAGASGVGDAFGNDRLNGAPLNLAAVTVAQIGNDSNGRIAFDPATGRVTVAAGTPAGSYAIGYRICEKPDTSNCADSTISVAVDAATLVAGADSAGPADGRAGATLAADAFGNDTLDGAALDPDDVTAAQVSDTSGGKLAFDAASGAVSVAAGTPAGSYTLVYRICETLNPANCAEANISVAVAAAALTAADDAVPDAVDGRAGDDNMVDVLANDMLDGARPALAEVRIEEIPGSTAHAGVTLDPATGIVSVAPGTPAGPYTIAYRLCERLNAAANCETAAVTLAVAAATLAAGDDPVSSPVDGHAGDENVVDVLANDTLNGAAPAPADIAITEVPGGAAHPGIALDLETGIVSVAARTPAGSHALGYRICETLNPANCRTATVTLTVAAAPLTAGTDEAAGGVDGRNGQAAVLNVLANDAFAGGTPTTADVEITVVQPALSPKLALDAGTGTVSVEAGTPAGDYAIGYRICERLDPSNCASASVRITVAAPAIAAEADAASVAGRGGQAAVLNVLANDRLAGTAPVPADVEITVVVPAASPKLALDPSTGIVSVEAGTPAGEYTLTYRIADRLNPSSNEAEATVTITVTPPALLAASETTPSVSGSAGDAQAAQVFENITLDGAAGSAAELVLTVPPDAGSPVTLDPGTGIVSVAPGTPAGEYPVTYEVCEKLNPANCASATVTVPVTAATVSAGKDDADPVPGIAGRTGVLSVLANDLLNGAPATAAKVTLAVVAPASHPGVTLDLRTGAVSVAPKTPAGSYRITYSLCERLNPANCDEALVTVPVTAATLVAASEETKPVPGRSGSPKLANAFANDRLDGAKIDLKRVTAMVTGAASDPGVTLDPRTGIVSVAAGTPAGTYRIAYRLCETLNPTNCADATVTVPVAAGTLTAADDATEPVAGRTGSPKLTNAFSNDRLDGAKIDLKRVTATVTGGASDPGVTLDPRTGIVTVAPGTPAGGYRIAYRLCETLNPTNCADAAVTVTVEAGTLTAADDAPKPVPGSTGNAKLANAFSNDRLDGAKINLAAITATVTKAASDGKVALDPMTGIVSVKPGTPAGTYAIGYRLCERLNPRNCAEATVTVVVEAGTLAAADDRTAPVSGAAGKATAGNVLGNDRLNGAAPKLPAVTLTVTAPAARAGVRLDPATGIVSVAPGTPAGTFAIGYRLCETLNPKNCDEATVSVPVGAARLAANDDRLPLVNGAGGSANAGQAFGNDRLNGAKLVPGAFTASVIAPAADRGVAMDPATGTVSVAAGTPAGLYTIGYRICEAVNPGNCDAATVSVRVEASAVVAADDTAAAPFDTKDAIPAALNLLANDRLGDAAAAPATVSITLTSALPKGFALSAEGVVSIAGNTASGDYAFGYRICEVLNPANCDTATASVQVRKSVPAVSGTVFLDADGDGVFDAGEKRLGGYRVELRQGPELVASTTSGADGAYAFADFPLGAGYTVVFVDPDTGTSVGAIPNLDFSGGEVRAGQDQAVEPDGVVYDIATGKPLAGAVLQLQARNGSPLPDACLLPRQQNQTTGADGVYRFDILFSMNSACPAKPSEYRITVTGFPAGTEHAVSAIAPPEAGVLDAGTCLIDAVRGGACQLSASAEAPPAGQPAPYVLAFRAGAGDPPVVNNHIPLDPLAAVPASGLSITKRASVSVARLDEAVAYVITATNSNGRAAGPLMIRDRLPAGFRLVEGSARVNDAEKAPKVSGRTLTFPGLKIPAGGSVEVTLSVRIGADVGAGEYANEAWAADANGEALTGTAKATVRVLAEAVFDCGEVIGKVFDDRDRDGAQSEGEKGLPGVRVVTYEGFLITTDAHGRFSVPCAALPDAAIGSNYILKLDTRTLPDGFALTTKNPRTVRLTAGKLSKVNFGATAGRTVAVELSGGAFRRNAAEPTPELQLGLAGLGDMAGEAGARLAVTYRRGPEPKALVEARLARVRALLGDVWQAEGTALPFEIRVVGAE